MPAEGDPETGLVTHATVHALSWPRYIATLAVLFTTYALAAVTVVHGVPLWGRLVAALLLASLAARAAVRARRHGLVGALREAMERTGLEGPLSVTVDEVCVAGVPVLRRAHIRAGLVQVLDSGRARVVIQQKFWGGSSRYVGGVLNIEVPSAREAQALAQALGTDVTGRTADFVVWSPRARALRNAMFAFAASACVGLYLAIPHYPLLGVVTFVLLVPLLSGTVGVAGAQVRIGADGVEHRWLWQRRFVPFREIRDFREEGDVLVLVLVDGSELRWATFKLKGEGTTLASRLREAMDGFRSRVADDGAAWLARGERSRSEWVSALRSLGAGGGRSYRASPPSKEALWRFVEDPAADVDVRAAAAIALGASLDDAGRARLRVAARVTVSPKLRVVLEQEAAGATDEDELEELGGAPQRYASLPAART